MTHLPDGTTGQHKLASEDDPAFLQTPAGGPVQPVEVQGHLSEACGILCCPSDDTPSDDNTNDSVGTNGIAEQPIIRVEFGHGLGDCVHFAHVLELYRRRGYDVHLSCAPDKEQIFQAMGATIDRAGKYPRIPWHEADHPYTDSADRYGIYNKAAINVSIPPLPFIGSPADIWNELKSIRLDIHSFIGQSSLTRVREFSAGLPRPIILLHTMGNTFPELKNLPSETTEGLYQELLSRTDGSLILLDWDNRTPRLASYRVRHLTDDWKALDVETLFALMFEADLLFGIDSGPLHAARLTDIPAVGLFPTRDVYPSRYALPRHNQVNLVPQTHTGDLNPKTRLDFNIIESGENSLDAGHIARTGLRMLERPHYLPSSEGFRGNLGSDVLLQELVGRTRGRHGALSQYVDRHKSFDLLLRIIGQRFIKPRIVETGCIRALEDWSAGYATYLLGAFLKFYGGTLVSVDCDQEHCNFARMQVHGMPVTVVCQDSVAFLRSLDQPVDVLYLDSMDTEHPEHAQHGLNEMQAALPLMHEQSLVVIDDTVYSKRRWTGKGALAVPWLLERGWAILYSGYQAVLSKTKD